MGVVVAGGVAVAVGVVVPVGVAVPVGVGVAVGVCVAVVVAVVVAVNVVVATTVSLRISWLPESAMRIFPPASNPMPPGFLNLIALPIPSAVPGIDASPAIVVTTRDGVILRIT